MLINAVDRFFFILLPHFYAFIVHPPIQVVGIVCMVSIFAFIVLYIGVFVWDFGGYGRGVMEWRGNTHFYGNNKIVTIDSLYGVENDFYQNIVISILWKTFSNSHHLFHRIFSTILEVCTVHICIDFY